MEGMSDCVEGRTCVRCVYDWMFANLDRGFHGDVTVAVIWVRVGYYSWEVSNLFKG